MKLWFAASMAVLVAACSPQAPSPAPSAIASSSAAPAPAAKRVALPDCASVGGGAPDGGAIKDCRLYDEKSSLGFEARFSKNPTPGEAETILSIQVVETGDAVLQTISEKVESTNSAMELQDLDGDGFPDLLVPLMTGNVNTEYAIWHMPAGARQFLRVGMVSGFGVGRTGDYVTVKSRGAANIQHLIYYTLKNGELKLVGAAEFTASGGPRKPTVKCAVLDGKADDPKGGLAVAGLTMALAKAQWCSEDAKKDAF